LAERCVRNAEVRGSTPLISTKYLKALAYFRLKPFLFETLSRETFKWAQRKINLIIKFNASKKSANSLIRLGLIARGALFSSDFRPSFTGAGK
jgi:hypothetical protein